MSPGGWPSPDLDSPMAGALWGAQPYLNDADTLHVILTLRSKLLLVR